MTPSGSRPFQFWLRRARYATWVALLVGIGYLLMRFDRITLSEGGCSPLLDLEPGASLLVDRWPPTIHLGDTLLFLGPDDELLLGRCQAPPPSAPQAIWDSVAEGDLWIVGDRPDCPSRDSRALGPVPPGRITGRVTMVIAP